MNKWDCQLRVVYFFIILILSMSVVDSFDVNNKTQSCTTQTSSLRETVCRA